MATATVAVPSASPQIPQSAPIKKTPPTFREALLAGWKVVEDVPTKSQSGCREGSVLLKKPGCSDLLRVDYLGTLKGYTFSAPKIVSE